ncbi:hypothetical protein [Sphingomonas sp. UYP23]
MPAGDVVKDEVVVDLIVATRRKPVAAAQDADKHAQQAAKRMEPKARGPIFTKGRGLSRNRHDPRNGVDTIQQDWVNWHESTARINDPVRHRDALIPVYGDGA